MNKDIEINQHIIFIDDNQSIINDYYKILAPSNGQDEENSQLNELENKLFGGSDEPQETNETGNNYHLASASQGEEGLELMREYSRERNIEFAMAFIDMRMPPGWDGLKTIHNIWAEFPDTEIVLCTAYSDASASDIKNMLGNNSKLIVLKKPFDSIEIVQLADSLTSRWSDVRHHRIVKRELEALIAKQKELLDKE